MTRGVVHRLAFVDGRFDAGRSALASLPAGVRLEAREGGGAVVRIERGVVVQQPIELLMLSHAGASDQRLVHEVVVEREAEVAVLERYVGAGDGRYAVGVTTRATVGEGARLAHAKLETEGAGAEHDAVISCELARDARLESASVALGAARARTVLNVRFGGEGGEATLHGLYVASAEQVLDQQTAIDHAVPRCTSHELYKGIVDGHAKASFNGLIRVHRDAQKTAAFQSNRNLLLSDDATIDTRPQLEIDADDVRCSHGATIGRLDDEALFYLRSRGIDVARARALMTYAFAAEVLAAVRSPWLGAELRAAVGAVLPEARAFEGVS